MKSKDDLEKELQLLQEMESIETRQALMIFTGVGTDPKLFEKRTKNAFLKAIFPRPMTRQEITGLLREHALGKAFFISFVNGSKKT